MTPDPKPPASLDEIVRCSDADVRDQYVPEWRREHGRRVLAVIEALRIAVEGLELFAAADTEWISGLASEHLAAVRELVDLGEKP